MTAPLPAPPPARPPNPYHHTIAVYDHDGQPLVTRAEAIELAGIKTKRTIGWERLALLPPPAGRIGNTLLWRRCDVAPLTLL